MDSEYVILGGGVAGLCAAIRLVELGFKPLLIEGGTYPTHKVCGEFFSPDSIALLKHWDIHPLPIREVHFHNASHLLKYPFSTPAGSLSHISFDPQLVARAAGATILTSTKVLKLQIDNSCHTLELDSGQKICTPNLLIATGRIPPQTGSKITPEHEFRSFSPVYTGIKAHFQGPIPQELLQMFFFKDAYLGVSPIEGGKYNVACLSKTSHYKKWASPEQFILHLRSQNTILDKILLKGSNLFSEWMTVTAPESGLRNTPDWPHTYFLGDAAGSIPPTTGNGLTLAIKSGIMAAEYAIHRNFKGFKQAWKSNIASPLRWGKALNFASMNPWVGNQIMKCGKTFPSIIDYIFQRTR